MKLTIRHIISLATAIKGLEGRQEAVQDSNGKSTVVVKPFDFESAQVRYALGRTQRHLLKVIADWNDDKKNIIRGATGGADEIKKDHESFTKVIREIEALEREELEVQVHLVKASDLKAHDNRLDPNLLADLEPMLTGIDDLLPKA